MNTFSNIALESVNSDLTRSQLLNRLSGSLHQRINKRGVNEQFSALLRTNYYPNENVSKRKCKGTFSNGCNFFTKYIC